jgi:ribonuclease PH
MLQYATFSHWPHSLDAWVVTLHSGLPHRPLMTATGWSSPVAVGSSDDDDPAVDEDEEEDDDADDDGEVAAGAEGSRAVTATASAMVPWNF